MQTRTIDACISWKPADAVEQSQQWVLTAMSAYGPVLITMLWRILGNEQDVCDAYQDTFLNLAHYREQTKPANVKAYLFRTSSNIAIAMLRRKKIEKRYTTELKADCKSASQSDHSNDFDAAQLCQCLREHITRLPDELREVIMLHDLAEMPYHQVAGILGITVGTARVYRWRAIQLLSVWMDGAK